MTARQAILQSAGPSHYVVQFDCDECIATVNRKQLLRPPLPILGEQCWINWNGEDYSAKVLAMGDLATAKKAEVDILEHMDAQAEDEVSQDVVDDDCSPPRKKRRFGFGKSKDTKKKKTKKISPKKKNKKDKPFVMELGSPADSPPHVGSSQSSTSSPKQSHQPPPPFDATLPVPAHPAPQINLSSFSVSSFSDDDDVVIKEAFRRKVISLEDDDSCVRGSSAGKKCKCLEEVMDALKTISSTVSLLEQKFSLSIERRLGEAVEGIKDLQQRQERLESQFQLFQTEYIKKHSVSSTPAQPSRVRTISSSTTPAQPSRVRTISSSTTPAQLFQDKTNRITMAESTSPSAGLDLDKSSCERSLLTFTEDGEDGESVENDCAEIHVTKDEIFRLSRASASRKNFAANLVRRVFTLEERASSNVKGVLGKQKLDPAKIAYVHKETFRMFPLESKETLKSAWSQCVGAIDEANRRLNRKKKQQENSEQ